MDDDGAGFGHGKGSQWTLFAWIYAEGVPVGRGGPLLSDVEARGSMARDARKAVAHRPLSTRGARGGQM